MEETICISINKGIEIYTPLIKPHCYGKLPFNGKWDKIKVKKFRGAQYRLNEVKDPVCLQDLLRYCISR